MKRMTTDEVMARRVRRAVVGVVTLLACAIALPPLAHGSEYWVEECTDGHPAAPDATSIGDPGLYVATDDCAGAGLLEIRPSQTAAPAQPKEARQWHYEAPTGATFKRALVDFGLISGPNDHVVSLFVVRAGETGQERLTHFSGGGLLSSTFDSDMSVYDELTRVGVRMSCPPLGTDCDYAPAVQARMNAARFLIADHAAPEAPDLSGPAASGDWLGGVVGMTVGGSDQGGGVARTLISANGVELVNSDLCDAEPDDEGRVGTMRPCPATSSHEESIDTAAAAFEEGRGNELRVCTEEYGAGPARGCRTIELAVDNVAPAAPRSLSLEGGTDWRRDNDFDLSWSNPSQDHAPITGAIVEVSGPGDYTKEYEYEGSDIETIKNLHVPEPGEYEARVYLVDEAGNATADHAVSIPLRFDNTVPPEAELKLANGWLSRDELTAGYLQKWLAPPEDQVPVSGIAGYRLTVDTNPSTDPCGGAIDPRACGGPITHHGIASNSQLLTLEDVEEGINWAHVVAVSGSGMRATRIDHATIKVDLTAPTTSLEGWSGSWSPTPLNLRAIAVDELSGMVITGEQRDDRPPRTVLEIDGVMHDDNDADVAVAVSEEGEHRVRFWARDLAGNENDGIAGHNPPREVTVRIDSSPPKAAFTNHQDPGDPDRLEVRASDSLSGLHDAVIAYRPSGGAWKELPTILQADGATARIDSEAMEADTEYEFRATVRDRAGNETVTTSRSDGSPMRTVGPLRPATRLVALRINGRRSARIAQRRHASLTGRLRTADSRPIADAKVRIIESYAVGARRRVRERVVEVDPDGRFAIKLRRGPSRTVVAHFDGNRRYLGSQSGKSRLGVRSAITLRAPRRARAGHRVTFRGRVRAPGARVRGKRVEIQVRVGRRWKAVGRSLRAKRSGKFRLRYRFVAAYRHPVRYRFRAVALRERGFPYLPSRSPQRRLTVRP